MFDFAEITDFAPSVELDQSSGSGFTDACLDRSASKSAGYMSSGAAAGAKIVTFDFEESVTLTNIAFVYVLADDDLYSFGIAKSDDNANWTTVLSPPKTTPGEYVSQSTESHSLRYLKISVDNSVTQAGKVYARELIIA